MRRCLALLALLSLANLTLVRGLQACAPEARPEAPRGAGHEAHQGHAGMVPVGESGRPADSGDHAPVNHCLTMSTCAVTLGAQGAALTVGAPGCAGRVIGLSDRRPHSWEAAPELPPPRA